jgi:hypothetical protein
MLTYPVLWVSGLNIITELVAGFLIPGKPIANVVRRLNIPGNASL